MKFFKKHEHILKIILGILLFFFLLRAVSCSAGALLRKNDRDAEHLQKQIEIAAAINPEKIDLSDLLPESDEDAISAFLLHALGYDCDTASPDITAVSVSAAARLGYPEFQSDKYTDYLLTLHDIYPQKEWMLSYLYSEPLGEKERARYCHLSFIKKISPEVYDPYSQADFTATVYLDADGTPAGYLPFPEPLIEEYADLCGFAK